MRNYVIGVMKYNIQARIPEDHTSKTPYREKKDKTEDPEYPCIITAGIAEKYYYSPKHLNPGGYRNDHRSRREIGSCIDIEPAGKYMVCSDNKP